MPDEQLETNPLPSAVDEPPAVRSPKVPQSAPRLAFLAVLAYVAFDMLLPLLHVPLRGLQAWEGLLLLVVPTAVFMLLQLWLSRTLVDLNPRPAISLALMLVSVLAWFAVLMYVRPHRDWSYPVDYFLVLLRPLLLGLSITTACTFFGVLLSRIIREPNVLLPVALIAMPIDYIGAMTPVGFTQNAVKQHPSIVQAVSVPVPTVGGLHPIAFIGPGDALFMAFFFAIVLRFSMNARGTFWWMYGLLTAAMLIVLTIGLPIAALVPMGLAVVIANYRFFKLKREEVFAVIWASIVVLAAVIGFYFYSHTHFFHSRKPHP